MMTGAQTIRMNGYGKGRCVLSSASGFTLLELLIVLVIITVMVSIAVPTVNNLTGVYLKTSSLKLAGNIKYLYDRAVLENLYIRLVFDLDNRVYYPESSSEPFFLSAKPSAVTQEGSIEEDEDKKDKEEEELDEDMFFGMSISSLSEATITTGQDGTEQTTYGNGLKWGGWADFVEKFKKRKANFSAFKSELSNKTTLPEEVTITGMYTPAVEEPVSRGKFYIHFFPNGYVEPAVIWLANSSDYQNENLSEEEVETYTLIVQALTGRAKLYDYREKIPEVVEDEKPF